MKLLTFALLLAAATTGCAVHSQAPIKEVAYDFTDYGYYDRQFGVSPQYEATKTADNEEAAEKAKKSADSDLVAFPCNKEISGEDEEITCYFHHKKGKGSSSSDVVLESEGASPAPAPQVGGSAPAK